MGGYSFLRQCWAEAVELGGVGHTSAALTRLGEVIRSGTRSGDDIVVSLAESTTASLLRQAGRHHDASVRDGRALTLAGIAEPDDSPWHRAATLDALVGLAADDLGQFRFAAAARLLDRARAVLPSSSDPDWLGARRPRLRVEWVCTELAVYTDRPEAARRHAAAASRIGDEPDVPERHRVKTVLIAAAAALAGGEHDRAARLAIEATERARAAGLLPLEWASWALRAGLPGSARTAQIAVRGLADARAELLRRGMPLDQRPL